MLISKKLKSKAVAIYIRVSTLDQAIGGYSLAAQRRILDQWVCDHGYTVYSVYEDAGISGKDIIHRPAMIQLLEDAKEGKFELVLVWALSRLTRSVADLYNTWEILCHRNIDIKSHTEPFDTSSVVGRAMMGILGVFAQMERELTSERVKMAMAERASSGKRTCNEVLGYDLDGSDSLKINQSEAERVQYIFDRYLEYHNLSAVAELCRLKGYVGKRGCQFKAQHIKKILANPVYAGYNSFKGNLYKGNYEPLIEKRLWDKVQKLISQTKTVGRPRIR